MNETRRGTERIEPLAPEPGAAESAWSEVLRRRRNRSRRAQALAGVALVAAVLAGTLPGRGGDRSPAELDVAAGPRRTATTTDSGPAGDPTRSDQASAANQTRSASGSTGPDRGPGTREAEPAGSAGSTRPAEPPVAGGPRSKPPVNRTRESSPWVGCLPAWCLVARATATEGGHDLGLDLCVPVGERTRRFSYETTQEIDLVVSASGAEPLWTWSAGQRFARGLHHLDVRAGECIRWTAAWDRTDEAGKRLPPGTYRLTASTLAEQVGENSQATTNFMIEQ